MYTLEDFYQSREWNKLLRTIKNERTNEEGNIICSYCGKGIVRKYDCIGHHKIELTNENINDYNISLNPDNIELVHHRCHNYIHHKFEYRIRKIYIVYGAPLSGKSTFVKNNMIDGDLVVDVDNIWECISGQPRYNKPHSIKPFVFQIRDLIIDGIKHRLGRWKTAYIIGGYPLQSERSLLCKMLGAQEIFIDTSKEECIKRLEEDADGRDKEEWMHAIDDWFDLHT